MTERLIVVGGDAGGMSGASQARRLRPADELQILAFERGPFTSYSSCGIPYWIAGTVAERDDLIARTPEEFSQRQGIEVATGTEVVAIDTVGRVVTVVGPEGERSHDYDQLLIGTGAEPVRPDLPGIDADNIFSVQSLVHATSIMDHLRRSSVEHAVIVGGGYIGLEMAEAMLERGIPVTLIQRGPHLMPSLDPELASQVLESMRAMGVDVRLECPATGFEAADGRVTGVVTPLGTISADTVFLGMGAHPRVDLARAAGIDVGAAGGIAVDDRQQTSIEGVWAAGDCAQARHRVTGEDIAVVLGTVANKQGRIAGLNIGGQEAHFPGVLGTAITRVMDLEIARTGVTEAEALAHGFAVTATSIDATTRAGYFLGATPMTVRLLTEDGTGRVVGGQIVGGPGAAKRIDTIATAIWNDMTAGDLMNVDLSYAPPFSGTWDPVLVAARVAAR